MMMHKLFGTTRLVFPATLLVAGCGIPGSGVGNAPGSPPKTEGPVSYGLDIQPIWDKNCVMCHRTEGIAETLFGVPMHLTSGQAIDDLVNVPSALHEGWVLVVPGDPEASLLYRKVADDPPPAGAVMPVFQPRLLDAELDLIRRWIEEGAEAN